MAMPRKDPVADTFFRYLPFSIASRTSSARTQTAPNAADTSSSPGVEEPEVRPNDRLAPNEYTLGLRNVGNNGLSSEVNDGRYLTPYEQAVENLRVESHLSDVPEFTHEFEKGIEKYREKLKKPYKAVKALLLSWENHDIDGLEEELEDFETILRETYHYDTTRLQIPDSERPIRPLRKKVRAFIEGDNGDCLYIIYYAGHGSRPYGQEPVWVP
jgi:hypothetical protein